MDQSEVREFNSAIFGMADLRRELDDAKASLAWYQTSNAFLKEKLEERGEEVVRVHKFEAGLIVSDLDMVFADNWDAEDLGPIVSTYEMLVSEYEALPDYQG